MSNIKFQHAIMNQIDFLVIPVTYQIFSLCVSIRFNFFHIFTKIFRINFSISGANGKYFVFSFKIARYLKSTSKENPISESSGVFNISSTLAFLLILISS